MQHVLLASKPFYASATKRKSQKGQTSVSPQYDNGRRVPLLNISLTVVTCYPFLTFSCLHNSLLRDLTSDFKFCLVTSSPVNPRISELIFCSGGWIEKRKYIEKGKNK
jgi:hypothetical protein